MDTRRYFWRLFLLGLGLGLIPLVLLFLSFSWATTCFGGCLSTSAAVATRQLASTLMSIGIWAWVLATLAGLILLFFSRLQPISYGPLMMVAISPTVAVVGCIVRLPSPYG